MMMMAHQMLLVIIIPYANRRLYIVFKKYIVQYYYIHISVDQFKVPPFFQTTNLQPFPSYTKSNLKKLPLKRLKKINKQKLLLSQIDPVCTLEKERKRPLYIY